MGLRLAAAHRVAWIGLQRQASQCSKPQALHPTHAWRAAVSAPGVHPECHTASDKGEIVSWV